ncbi:MAG: hypothetical protein LBU27_00160 [Candidatus Peribacteria bacterium]|jgi:hypothetical protein|nr:hypothetical protein [Candidatus Peribacteria bacterium]
MLETHKELDEQKKKQHQEQLGKQYEKQRHLNQTKLEVQELKYLVETGAIDKQTFETIVEDGIITDKEFEEVLSKLDIQKLFEKLEEIEKADEEHLIPKVLKVNKQEYLQAFQSPQKREEVLQKFDDALNIICNTMHGGQTMHGNLFSTSTYMLSQKLIPVQENIIDLGT